MKHCSLTFQAIFFGICTLVLGIALYAVMVDDMKKYDICHQCKDICEHR